GQGEGGGRRDAAAHDVGLDLEVRLAPVLRVADEVLRHRRTDPHAGAAAAADADGDGHGADRRFNVGQVLGGDGDGPGTVELAVGHAGVVHAQDDIGRLGAGPADGHAHTEAAGHGQRGGKGGGVDGRIFLATHADVTDRAGDARGRVGDHRLDL